VIVSLPEQETSEAVATTCLVGRVWQTCFKITEAKSAVGDATNHAIQVPVILRPHVGSDLHLVISTHPRHNASPYGGVGPLGVAWLLIRVAKFEHSGNVKRCKACSIRIDTRNLENFVAFMHVCVARAARAGKAKSEMVD